MADEEDLEGEGAQPSGAGKAARRDSMSNLCRRYFTRRVRDCRV